MSLPANLNIQPEVYEQAKKKKIIANIRLCRDVLEFKKEHNKVEKDRSLAFITATCFHKMANDYEDRPGYQVFDPLSVRQDFFAEFEEGNESLVKNYDLGELKTLSEKHEPSYPGLVEQRRQELNSRLNRLLKSPKNISELYLRRFINEIMKSLPGGKTALAPAKNLYNSYRLLLRKW